MATTLLALLNLSQPQTIYRDRFIPQKPTSVVRQWYRKCKVFRYDENGTFIDRKDRMPNFVRMLNSALTDYGLPSAVALRRSAQSCRVFKGKSEVDEIKAYYLEQLNLQQKEYISWPAVSDELPIDRATRILLGLGFRDETNAIPSVGAVGDVAVKLSSCETRKDFLEKVLEAAESYATRYIERLEELGRVPRSAPEKVLLIDREDTPHHKISPSALMEPAVQGAALGAKSQPLSTVIVYEKLAAILREDGFPGVFALIALSEKFVTNQVNREYIKRVLHSILLDELEHDWKTHGTRVSNSWKVRILHLLGFREDACFPSFQTAAANLSVGLADWKGFIHGIFGLAEAYGSCQVSELVKHKFVFSEQSSDCNDLGGTDPATSVQAILESYGLGYALLLAHRIDQCNKDRPTHLVKDLHNDLYKWLHRKVAGAPVDLVIFRQLKIAEPSGLEQFAHLSTIQLTLAIEKQSIEELRA